jgi:hypothetical protein
VPSRNDPCPCRSGNKYKRCCLSRLEEVGRQLREREELMDDVIAWLRSEHEETVHAARAETGVVPYLRGPVGRNMSLVWALNDYRPNDGGPSLMDRYAQCPELGPSAQAIARSLADARLAVYRVGPAVHGLWLELEPLAGGAAVQIAWRDGLGQLRLGEILVARVVDATALPTLWGLGGRFPGASARCWQARLASLPDDPAAAALMILSFHPDDAAEPLPEGVELHTWSWSIDNDIAVSDAIEEEDLWESLGESLPSGWAFAWPGEASSAGIDLGGWQEHPGEIEIARLIVDRQEMTLVSADRDTLQELAHHVGTSLGDLISPRPDTLAA